MNHIVRAAAAPPLLPHSLSLPASLSLGEKEECVLVYELRATGAVKRGFS